jgi:hypothetical protein
VPQKSQIAKASEFGFLSALFFAFCITAFGFSASAKTPTAVWHVDVSGQDSLFNEGLARDLSQALAEDTSLKVFDARRRGAGLLDSLHARSPYPKAITLRDALPNGIELAIRVSCRPLETSYACRTEGRFILGAEREVIDSAHFTLEAGIRRRLFGACIARRWRERWQGATKDWPANTVLTFKKPALPARLLRDLEILREGSISEMPPGTELETGDMAAPALAQRERVSYVLFPNGHYAYPIPQVMQVLRGTMGIWQLQDTTTLANRLMQTTRLDSANLIWRTLGKVTTLDSTQTLWSKLGQLAGLDSGFIWHQLGLLALHDSSVLLTPSCVIRGQPQAMLIKHEGSETTIELVQGEIAVLPLLSSQSAVRVPPLHQGVTRGFSIEVKKMSDRRSENLSADLVAVAAPKSGRSLAELLPGRLFNRSTTLPALHLDVQDFLAGELSEIDAMPNRLGPPDWNAAGTLNPLPPGKHEAGCYLCRPDRLGP